MPTHSFSKLFEELQSHEDIDKLADLSKEFSQPDVHALFQNLMNNSGYDKTSFTYLISKQLKEFEKNKTLFESYYVAYKADPSEANTMALQTVHARLIDSLAPLRWLENASDFLKNNNDQDAAFEKLNRAMDKMCEHIKPSLYLFYDLSDEHAKSVFREFMNNPKDSMNIKNFKDQLKLAMDNPNSPILRDNANFLLKHIRIVTTASASPIFITSIQETKKLNPNRYETLLKIIADSKKETLDNDLKKIESIINETFSDPNLCKLVSKEAAQGENLFAVLANLAKEQQTCCASILRKLLEYPQIFSTFLNKADATTMNSEGYSVFDYMTRDYNLFKFLLEKYPEIIHRVNEEGFSLLHHAVRLEDQAIVELLLEKRVPTLNYQAVEKVIPQ